MTTLAGKTAVITGGSRGIGAASAIALAQQGAQVVLTYFSQPDAAASVVQAIVADGGRAECSKLDATDPDDVSRFASYVADKISRVDILFNNAGDLVARKPLEQITVEFYRQVMDVNVLSTILVTQAMLPLMDRGGVVVNMSSLAARDGGGPNAAMYAASKGATASLTRAWAKEFAPRGIRVNAVAPGFIDTDFQKRHSAPDLAANVAASCTAGKAGVPEDVARAVVYLAGEGNGFINGAMIDINGGMLMP
jgi:3-oxoacyl-[acyl-carrier protein] reductase